MVSAFLSALSATPLIRLQETVLPVSQATIWLRVDALTLLITQPNLLIWGAEHGIGPTKFVSLALTNGPSMLKRFAFQFLTNAGLMLRTVTVPNVSRDMI